MIPQSEKVSVLYAKTVMNGYIPSEAGSTPGPTSRLSIVRLLAQPHEIGGSQDWKLLGYIRFRCQRIGRKSRAARYYVFSRRFCDWLDRIAHANVLLGFGSLPVRAE